MIRSHSLPLLLSSLSMRSAKFGHGTNSNFMLTLVCAVKSLLSSTKALAGSHAAQHNVMVLPAAVVAAGGAAALAAAGAAGSSFLPQPTKAATSASADSAGTLVSSDLIGGLLTFVPSPEAHTSDRRSVQVLGRQDLDARLHHVECPA